MRAIPNFAQPNPAAPIEQRVQWLENMMQQFLLASQDDTDSIADAYQVQDGPVSPLRIFNVSTATPEQVRDLLATWILDYQARGTNRGVG